MVQRAKFMEIGGLDTTLGDLLAPDDTDFIARYIAYYKESFKKLSPDCTWCVVIDGKEIKRKRQTFCKNTEWIKNINPRSPDRMRLKLQRNKLYAELRGIQLPAADTLAANIDYFLTHDAKIDFLACKSNGEPFVVKV